MFLFFLAALVLGGAVAGSFSGMLGIGGSILLVPLQFYLLTRLGYPPDIALKTAIATALFFTLPTSLSSAYNHSKRNTVLWKKGLLMGVFGFVFSFAGGYIASHLNAAYLSIIFGVVVLGASLKFTTTKNANEDPEKMSQNPIIYAVCGSLMGLLSGLTGIGGGLVLIPLVIFLAKMPLRQAIGTSSATIIFTAFGGVISYIINGIGVEGLPPYSFGYVNLIMWIALVIPGVILASVGAKLSHKLNQKYMRNAFTVITFLVGVGMILKGFLM
ncbi:sulfite exporter TauE/SafE family protein [Methanimicrococcus blatticola]|nr:sulfite exporter TauE/SafE family protein [Methanimicrococcus blatticola]MCC2508108.1 sulfite exporter TauE/SafE family protein [Methanimicrococcus blatticola]